MATWAMEAHSKVHPTGFFFRIALGFVENGPFLYLLSGYYYKQRKSKTKGRDLKPEKPYARAERCTEGFRARGERQTPARAFQNAHVAGGG